MSPQVGSQLRRAETLTLQYLNCMILAAKMTSKDLDDKIELESNDNCDWILMSYRQMGFEVGKEYYHVKFEINDEFVISSPRIFMIENANNSKYMRDYLKYDTNWRIHLKIDSRVECLDTNLKTPKWYEAFVKDIRHVDRDAHKNYHGLRLNDDSHRKAIKLFNRQFQIKFVGYSDRFNIWLEFDSQQLAPINTHVNSFYW